MRKSIHDSLKSLLAAESVFIGSEFLAPVVHGRRVGVKIAGVRCALSVNPADFNGWGIFRAASFSHALLIRPASAAEQRKYLRLFRAVCLIVCSIHRNTAQATPANPADDHFCFDGPVDVRLCERTELFDTIIARFDGSQFWFDETDPRADSAAAAFLRRELAQMTDPKELARPGLTSGQRLAYALQYTHRVQAILAQQRRRADGRLAIALAHAGAVLCDFADAQDAYRVTFTVDGVRHTSVVRKNDLTVHSAGICLAGQDHDFDLNSLIGVLREASSL